MTCIFKPKFNKLLPIPKNLLDMCNGMQCEVDEDRNDHLEDEIDIDMLYTVTFGGNGWSLDLDGIPGAYLDKYEPTMAPDPEERHWKNMATHNERFSDEMEDDVNEDIDNREMDEEEEVDDEDIDEENKPYNMEY